MPDLAVYCADVGSTKKGNFGWAREEVPTGTIQRHRGGGEIVELVDALAEDLGDDVPVALGFECPLFVPVRKDPLELTSARPGEGSRPWSAGAGVGALGTGLVEAAWVLAGCGVVASAAERPVRREAGAAVLEKNGFETIGLARRYLKVAGEWRDHLLFQRTAD